MCAHYSIYVQELIIKHHLRFSRQSCIQDILVKEINKINRFIS